MCNIEAFQDYLASFGYSTDSTRMYVGFNVLGYASVINPISQWAGYTVSALTHGISIGISSVVGVARIAFAAYEYYTFLKQGDPDNIQEAKNSCIGHVARGVAEIAGLAPALIIIDLVASIYFTCNCSRNNGNNVDQPITASQRLVG